VDLRPKEADEVDAGLTGKVALIAGGGGGAGPTIARAFAAEGAAIAVHYRGSAERAKATAEEITGAGGRAMAVQADLTDPAAIEAMLDEVESGLGPLAILVNATSLYREQPLAETDDTIWHEIHEAMLGATFRTCRAAAPRMAATGFGRIVNIASRSGIVGAPSLAANVSAKAGIIGLTRALAKELGPQGILVNAVAPVYVVTDRGPAGRSVSEEDEEKRTRTNPLRRYATAEDLAHLVLWLGSAHNSYVNGEVVTLSGGARS
jgi:NAD(P)-dependent dehydrogenase (short-subunit alcohol dehydrogenase family)